MVPEDVEDMVSIDDMSYAKVLTAKTDILVVAEGVYARGLKINHARFIRLAREDGKGLNFAEVEYWPLARRRLRDRNIQRLHALGGFNRYAVAYGDERLIADYLQDGAYGWVIPKTYTKTF